MEIVAGNGKFLSHNASVTDHTVLSLTEKEPDKCHMEQVHDPRMVTGWGI